MAHGSMLRKVSLTTTPGEGEIRALRLGDVVYLDGYVYTAREGVYRKVIDEGTPLPAGLTAISEVNFHCAPAVAPDPQSGFRVGAVTATASFRFSKWIGDWFRVSGARIVIGKGGMNPGTYRETFVPHGAIYLTTVGYGTGALLGRGVKDVHEVHWREELGLAQAMWVFEVENFGPFIVESDASGDSLFERENARIAKGLPQVYEGTRPAVLGRFGETDDRGSELI